MASTISYSLGSVGLVRGIEDQRYIGLRPLAAQVHFHAAPSVKAQRSMHVKASNEQETKVKSSGLSIEECEAAAVAGKFPDPPPFVRPSGPKGTPVITPQVLTLNRC